jgi:hypothetical protein
MSANSGAKLDGISVSVLRLVSPDGTKVMYSSIDNSGNLTTNAINPLTTYVPNILNNGWIGTTPTNTATTYTALQVGFDGIIGTTRTIASSPSTTISNVSLVNTNILQFDWSTSGAAATTLLLFTVSNSTNTGTRTRILPVSLIVTVGPNTIAGLVGWWDASDNTTVLTTGDVQAANGQPVTKWMDKSGAANHFNVVNVNSPTYVTSSINSKNVIRFVSGSTNSLNTTSNFTSVDGLNSASIFWVATYEATGFPGATLFGQGGNATSATSYMQYDQSNRMYTYRFINGSVGGAAPINAGPSAAGTNNIAFINGFTWSSTSSGRNGEFEGYYHDSSRFVNKLGLNVGGAIPIPTGRGPLVVGCGNLNSTVTSAQYVGRVAEIVIYNNSISDSDYTGLQTYFNNKWGLNLF